MEGRLNDAGGADRPDSDGRGRGRRFWSKLGLSLVVLAACLVLAELYHRVAVYGRGGLSLREMRSVHALGESGLLRAPSVPGLRYELVPGVDTRFKMRPFRTSSAGLRDHEYPLAKDPGVFRIVAIGDSFTMGSGVALERVYHSVLENRLNEESGSTRFEVLNFGVGGYGLRDYVAVLERKALPYDPDLILLGLTRNDQTPISRRPSTFHPKPVADPSVRFTLLDTLARALAAHRQRRALEAAAATSEERPDAAPASGRAPVRRRTRYVRETFAELRALAEEARVPVLAAHLFVGFNPAGSQSLRRFEKAALDNGFHFLDVSPGFEGLDTRALQIFANDRHPNEAAHAIFAERIHAFLRRTELIPD